MDHAVNALVTVALGIIGLATLAALVSKNANTSGVISAGASGFAQDLGAALSPITGQTSFLGGGASIPGTF